MNRYLPDNSKFCIFTRFTENNNQPALITSVRGSFYHWVFIIPFIMITLAIGLVISYNPDTIAGLISGYISIIVILGAVWFYYKGLPRIRYSGKVIMNKENRVIINKSIMKLAFKKISIPYDAILIADEHVKTIDNKFTESKMYFSNYRLFIIPMTSIGIDKNQNPTAEQIQDKVTEFTYKLSTIEKSTPHDTDFEGLELIYKGGRYEIIYSLAYSIGKVFNIPFVDNLMNEAIYHKSGEEQPSLVERLKTDEISVEWIKEEYEKHDPNYLSGIKDKESNDTLKMRFSGSILSKIISGILLALFTISGLLVVYPLKHGYLYLIIPLIFFILIFFRRTYITVNKDGIRMERRLSAVPLPKNKFIPIKELMEISYMNNTLIFFAKDGGIITTLANKHTAYALMLKIKLWIADREI